ncbi:hypothetical protein FRZ67_11385 [Panacibacter ginsenosidivorans]|uniref:Uncharacterized protein n=1 Tax=Panacibacter ginsenosidivorans TaxID=1813871 RepID=A0A5B8V945_9BACT|nr:hypothetical protein [Panacibacter ginsenosidivorans]QEC67872.1 hypothetical protein FRZ67_11385 [Panacibacter ginsenosidivorans]
MKISSNKEAVTYIQSSMFNNQGIKKSRYKASPLEQKKYGRGNKSLFYAIIYGCIIGALLFLILR